MIDQFEGIREQGIEVRPICSRYECLILGMSGVMFGFGHGERQGLVLWSVGSDVDGGLEVAGAWCELPRSRLDGAAVLGCLRLAGLERAAFVILRGLGDIDLASLVGGLGAITLGSPAWMLSAACTGACSMDRRRFAAITQLLARSGDLDAVGALAAELAGESMSNQFVEDLRRLSATMAAYASVHRASARAQRRAVDADWRIQKLTEALERDIRRHGSFASEGEATRFVERSLERQIALSSRGRGRVHSYRNGLKSAPLFGSVRGTTPPRV